VTLLSMKVILFVSSTTLPIEHEAQILPGNIVKTTVTMFQRLGEQDLRSLETVEMAYFYSRRMDAISSRRGS
jgi:hypothetical protein